MNFTIASAYGLIIASALSLLHLIACRPWRFAPARSEVKVPRYGRIERLIHLGLTVGFLALIVTSFYPVLTQQALEGWLLMIHVGLSPLFFLSLLAALIVWGEDCCYGKVDCEWLGKRLRNPCGDPAGLPGTGRFDPLQKTYFWLAGVLGLALLVTMLLSMVPLYGTEGQEILLRIHRWCALLLLVLTVLHAYRTVLGKPGGWASLITGKVSDEWMKKYHP